MKASDAIRQRHSVRRFLPEPVDKSQIRFLLDIASHSPSGANTQPWQVAVLTGNSKQQLCRHISESFEAGIKPTPDYEYYPLEWQDPYLSRRRACGLQLYQSLGIDRKDKAAQKAQWSANYRAFDAPVMLLFWMDGSMQTGSFIDFGMFLQSFMIAAVEAGLATCPQAALAEYSPQVKAFLDIPDDAKLVCGMALGYEDRTAAVNQYRTTREYHDSFTRFYD